MSVSFREAVDRLVSSRLGVDRRGLTFVEILVAMLIAGIAVTAAAGILRVESRLVTEMDTFAERWDRESNGLGWLRQALVSVEVRNEERWDFAGAEAQLRFRSHRWVPDGWTEPRVVSVTSVGDAIIAAVDDDPPVILADSLESATFEYLISFGAESPWEPQWESDVRPPVAVRLLLRHPGGAEQSTVFFLGDRG